MNDLVFACYRQFDKNIKLALENYIGCWEAFFQLIII